MIRLCTDWPIRCARFLTVEETVCPIVSFKFQVSVGVAPPSGLAMLFTAVTRQQKNRFLAEKVAAFLMTYFKNLRSRARFLTVFDACCEAIPSSGRYEQA